MFDRYRNKEHDVDPDFATKLPLLSEQYTFVLLCVMWTTWLEIELIRRFPECLELDDTASSNSKGYPWGFVVGQDSNKKTILWGSAIFCIGVKRVTYTWLLTVALPGIYGSRLLQEVAIISSDGAELIHRSIDDAQNLGIVGGKRSRDFWHQGPHTYTKNVMAGASKEEKEAIHIPIMRTCLSIPIYLLCLSS